MNVADRVVVLAGGVGGAKLAVGLASVLPPQALTVIVNTGDDFEHWGLHVSPDLDTVMYSLAGLANPETGWGVAGDTFNTLRMVERYGGPDWFNLGDKDLAASLLRTDMLRHSHTLTQATAALASKLGIRCAILPMSDDPVRTVLETDQGEMFFQEYFVRERWQPVVRAIRFDGADLSRLTPPVAAALEAATLIIFGPSNPYLSIDPILAVPGVRQRIKDNPALCLALSPIIGGQAVKGPAAKLMVELGQEVSPFGIAKHYEELLKGIILDVIDHHFCDAIESIHIRTAVRETIMHTHADKAHLASELIAWARELAT